MEIIRFEFEKKYVKDFINFSKRLYSKKENMEDEKEIFLILTNKHPLNKYFKIDKFLVYEGNDVVGRFAITTYPKDKKAYLGFFECTDDSDVAKLIFDTAIKFAKDNNYESIVGPVNASFWIKYRLKINKFDKLPYTCEPYNKEYYLKLFKENGFDIIEHYTSNIYKDIPEEYSNEKYSTRYEEFLSYGYKIESLKKEDFNKFLEDLYYMITKLYCDFPIYKDLEKEDFIETFKNYEKVMDMSMIKIAYYEDKMVGFFVGVPDYGNKVYQINLINLFKILNIKKKPKKYIMLYIGVDPKHTGLGKALTYSIMKELINKNALAIGALARDGKITQNYVDDLIEDRYEYVILERKI